MGSFFKNLIKSNNPKSTENEPKKTSKWLFLFKKQTENFEQIIPVTGQQDNQGKLKYSNSSSSMGSLNISDNSFATDDTLLLPRLKKNNFSVPRFIPPNEWIKSQLFEVIHLISSLVDLISSINPTLSEHLDNEIDQIVQIIDEAKCDFKIAFIQSFNVISTLYKEEAKLWLELKFEAHINSLIAQLAELSSQLPGNASIEITDSVKAQDSGFDLFAYKMALERLESRTILSNNCEVQKN